MSIIKKSKDCLFNVCDHIAIFLRRRNEINKFKDAERVKITDSFPLSKEQERAVDALFLEHYGKKIPYTWHRNFSAHSGKFDANYFPELLYIPEFERFMNLNLSYNAIVSDKNVLPLLTQNYVKTPASIVSGTKGLLSNSKREFITVEEACDILCNIGRVFIKPTVDSCSGEGCFIANIANGWDNISQKTAMELLSSLGGDFVIQEVLTCHESIRQIYSGSVNTFRVITYRWKDKIEHMPVIMRIGQGGAFVDNAHAGGMFIAIDDDGTMHKTAMTEFNTQFDVHPDTGFRFENAKLSLVPTVIQAAKRMHVLTPQIGVINWDFTLDEAGEPVLIEANIMGGSVWLPQMAHGCGAFGERTAEVLQWIRFMKKIKATERHKYAFGKMK